MAWLELEGFGVYHIAFRLGDRKFKKSLRTKSEIEAEARRHRLEENLRLVESGRLSIPQDCDASVFLMSDGKLNRSPKVAKSLSLGSLCESYLDSIPDGALEATTIHTTRVHMRHVARLLGSRRSVRSVAAEHLQKYVTARSNEPGMRGRNVSVGTIKEELSTFSTHWTWCLERGYVSVPFPKPALKYPKHEQKPPFQTWQQIERQIRRGQLSNTQAADLWDGLHLDRMQLSDLLKHIEDADSYGFMHPMCVVAAYTGARRSELCRSRVTDFDFEAGTLLIRERKRARGKHTTRLVPLACPCITGELKEPFVEVWQRGAAAVVVGVSENGSEDSGQHWQAWLRGLVGAL